MDGSRDPADEVLAALESVVVALDANTARTALAARRAADIRARRAEGSPYREIVSDESRPLIVELLTDSLHALQTAGSELRRAQARALHREGLTTEQIAELFGVSRQRVSALLRTPPPAPEDGRPTRRPRGGGQ